MTPDPPAVQVWPGVVRLSGPALIDAYVCVVAGIDRAKCSDRSTERLEGLRRAFYNAMTASGHFEVKKIVESPAVQDHWGSGEVVSEIGTKAAAALAGVDERTTRRWAEAGLGRRVGRDWLIPADHLAALLEKRKARHGS